MTVRWEYMTLDKPDDESVQDEGEMLVEQGAGGWELVHVRHVFVRKNRFYFKRQVPLVVTLAPPVETKIEPTPAEAPVRVEIRGQEATTISNTPYGTHLETKANGQQRDYVVLTEAERAKGFVEPVRRSYVHLKCGGVTTMSHALAETYARDPGFYSGTYCATCKNHFPVGENGEFRWDGTNQLVGTKREVTP